MQSLSTEVKELITSWEGSGVEIFSGLHRKPFDIIKTIAYHSLDKHISGDRDPLTGHIKPFYNISRYRVNVATRATDFSTKDMRLEAEDAKFYARAMLLQKRSEQWMKEVNFAKTLNVFGWLRAEYGKSVIKFTEKDGEMYVDNVYLHNLIFDPTDFEDGVKVEKHEMNAVQLQKMRDVWDNIDEAIEELKHKATDNKRKYTASVDTITVYEVEGVFPKTFVDEDADENEYSLQLHYVAGENCNIVLYSKEIDQSRYEALDWQSVPGSSMGKGIVEDSFQAQAWTNVAKLQEVQMMDYGSKVVLQSPDANIGSNILTEVVNGQILQTSGISQVDLTPRTINQLEALFQSWDVQVEKTTHTFNAVTGEDMPSNTPLGAVQIQNSNAESYFAYRREEAGIFWTQVWQNRIMPHIVKLIEKEGIVTAEYTQTELSNIIDEVYIARYVEGVKQAAILNMEEFTPEDEAEAVEKAQKELKKQSNRRTLKFPKDTFKRAKMRVSWVTTNEQRNKLATLTNLNNILQTAVNAPQLLEGGPLSELFAKIIETAGLGMSPAQLGIGMQPPRQQQGRVPQQQELPEEANIAVNA